MEGCDFVMLSRMFSLVAEMESLKAEIEMMKAANTSSPGCWEAAHFKEKADQIWGIAQSLQALGHG